VAAMSKSEPRLADAQPPAEGVGPLCPKHHGATLAVATVTYPDGQAGPELACSGCAKNAIADALSSGRAVRIDPVPSAYGICPHCGESVRLRPASGEIGSHRAGWVKCGGQGSMPVPPREGGDQGG
jgi:hypothetical protein